MSGEQSKEPASRPGKGFLIASGLCALVFIANVIVGKVSVSQGATEASGVGDVVEFLILLVAVILFIIACLARERASATVTANK